MGVLKTMKARGKYTNVCDIFLTFLGGVAEVCVGFPVGLFE